MPLGTEFAVGKGAGGLSDWVVMQLLLRLLGSREGKEKAGIKRKNSDYLQAYFSVQICI